MDINTKKKLKLHLNLKNFENIIKFTDAHSLNSGNNIKHDEEWNVFIWFKTKKLKKITKNQI